MTKSTVQNSDMSSKGALGSPEWGPPHDHGGPHHHGHEGPNHQGPHGHGGPDGSPPMPVIIGAAVGGAVLLVAIVVAVLLVRRRKKRARIAATLGDNVALNTSTGDLKNYGAAPVLADANDYGGKGSDLDSKSAAQQKQDEAMGLGENAGSSTMARALSVQYGRQQAQAQPPQYVPGQEAVRPPVYVLAVQPQGGPAGTPPVYAIASETLATAEPPVYEVPTAAAAGRHTVPGHGNLQSSNACA